MVFRSKSEAACLADQVERSFRGGAWHGLATREALNGIDAAMAGRRPDGSPHTIIEHVRHMTFWLAAAYLRLTGEQESFANRDWPEEKQLTDDSWKRAIVELEEAHMKLYTALLDLDDDSLDRAVPGTDPTVRGMLLGILQHNAYHTGQIVQVARELTP